MLAQLRPFVFETATPEPLPQLRTGSHAMPLAPTFTLPWRLEHTSVGLTGTPGENVMPPSRLKAHSSSTSCAQ